MLKVSFPDHFVKVFCDNIQESTIVTYYFCTSLMQACMFVNITPLESNVPETISTLEFGENARQVELGKATKHVTRHAV